MTSAAACLSLPEGKYEAGMISVAIGGHRFGRRTGDVVCQGGKVVDDSLPGDVVEQFWNGS